MEGLIVSLEDYYLASILFRLKADNFPTIQCRMIIFSDSSQGR
jgi:hypothetical protein